MHYNLHNIAKDLRFNRIRQNNFPSHDKLSHPLQERVVKALNAPRVNTRGNSHYIKFTISGTIPTLFLETRL